MIDTSRSIYFNIRTSEGVETLEEVKREASQSPKEFRRYISEMVREYHISGCNVYISSRCTKEWRNRN